MSLPSRRHILRCVGSITAISGVATGARYRSEHAPTSDAVAWKRTYGDSDFQCHAIGDANDGVLVVGRTGSSRSETAWLAEIGADGTAQWTTTIDTPGFTRAVDIVSVDSGYTVLGTIDESPRLWLVHLDDDGQEQWRRRAKAPYGIRALHPTTDGYLIWGYRGNPRRVDADLRAWVRAVDVEGHTRWEHTYDGDYVSDLVPRDEGFLLAGGSDDDAWLCAINSDGTPAWRHTYGGVGSEGVSVAVPVPDGVLYGGSTGSIPDVHSRGMLVRTTADGEFVCRQTYDPQSIVDLTPFGDGYALTGEPQNQNQSGRNPEKPIHVVDRWGRVQQTVTVSVKLGTPIGLSRFGDGTLVVGGWSGEDGIWLAKIKPDVEK